MTWYAWSDIQYGAEVEEGTNQILRKKVHPIGTVVTPEDLGINETEFKHLISAGSIRAYEFPKMPDNWSDSPVNWLKHQTRLIEQQATDLSSGLTSDLGPLGDPSEEANRGTVAL